MSALIQQIWTIVLHYGKCWNGKKKKKKGSLLLVIKTSVFGGMLFCYKWRNASTRWQWCVRISHAHICPLSICSVLGLQELGPAYLCFPRSDWHNPSRVGVQLTFVIGKHLTFKLSASIYIINLNWSNQQLLYSRTFCFVLFSPITSLNITK